MLKSYQTNFLKKIHELTAPILGLELLVVYGSYVRGELTPKSDVDFFALFHDPEALEKGEETLFEILTEECDGDLELPASLYAVHEDETPDKSFFYGILTEGFMITPPIYDYFTKVMEPTPRVLYTYSMEALLPKNKVKVNQILYGYSQKKGDKRYDYGGLLKHIQGEKVRSGLLIPQEHELEMDRFMRENKLSFKKRVVFV
jgi:predicted nucleotidyltransferase